MAIYADVDDVVARYEGVIPDDRQDWVATRLDDVEAELIGLVPSLATDVSATDPARAARVKRLICDKLLELYRNPDGAVNVSTSMGPFTESRTLSGSRSQRPSPLSFTAEELRSVRSRTRRTNLGMATIAPWNPGSCA